MALYLNLNLMTLFTSCSASTISLESSSIVRLGSDSMQSLTCQSCLYRGRSCSGSLKICNVYTNRDTGFHWSPPIPQYGPTECFWPVHQWYWWTNPPRSSCCGANTVNRGTICEHIYVCTSCSRVTKRCLHLIVPSDMDPSRMVK